MGGDAGGQYDAGRRHGINFAVELVACVSLPAVCRNVKSFHTNWARISSRSRWVKCEDKLTEDAMQPWRECLELVWGIHIKPPHWLTVMNHSDARSQHKLTLGVSCQIRPQRVLMQATPTINQWPAHVDPGPGREDSHEPRREAEQGAKEKSTRHRGAPCVLRTNLKFKSSPS